MNEQAPMITVRWQCLDLKQANEQAHRLEKRHGGTLTRDYDKRTITIDNGRQQFTITY